MEPSVQVTASAASELDRERGEPLPVLPALRPVLGAGLAPGSVVSVGGAGAASLGLALLAGASEAGVWCGVVGVPELGVVAAAGMGVRLDRTLLVDEPGARWPDAVATLADAVGLVVARPVGRVAGPVVRRLSAVVRRSGCVLVVSGGWEGARLGLRMEWAEWVGAEDGRGHLRGRRARVAAEPRGRSGAGRRVSLWLPGPDGTVSAWTGAERADGSGGAAPRAEAG
ncbi:hypothetical protein [Allonocardiopsis opalescens]|uniref:Protein RecA n=1 Tax=Allonocardiopsis opalescens TaxID=1144618 RepID=A0A2T0QEK6_9ACTN|nr:hypothetical protein [Allonocardiopsis opalescens]PRY02283.1 hypothetical protein CLV72_101885 [Allonocardiopsis opalescens]